jgi:hypothetical protein
VECIEAALGTFFVSYKFKFVLDWFVWAFYGPNANSNRHFMWEELSGVFNWWEVPW